MAVTKYVDAQVAGALVEAGCDILGESRPQPFCEKAKSLEDLSIHWHMIGHLQRNKVRRVLPLVEMIHSADSPRLIGAIDRIAGELSLRVTILLEVNISNDAAKHGFRAEAVEPFLVEATRYPNVEIRGLMCMAGRPGDQQAARADFARLRQLREQLRENCPDVGGLDELSMGMSGDFEVAIEEGATIVRVGSALFRGLL